MTIGDKIRILRAQRRWSQEGLGLSCGLPQKTISHYELGHFKPGLAISVRLCKAFGITLDEFVEGVDL